MNLPCGPPVSVPACHRPAIRMESKVDANARQRDAESGQGSGTTTI